jgi:hypothetical protein
MSDTSTVPRKADGQEPARGPVVDPELADELLARAEAGGVELLGPDGLLSQVTKSVLERALAEEMTGHLGYEKHDPAGRGSGNSRNGSTPKTVLTDIGAVDLAVPRDRPRLCLADRTPAQLMRRWHLPATTQIRDDP